MTHIIMVLEGRYTVGDSLFFVGKAGNAVWAENQTMPTSCNSAHTATLRLARVGRNSQTQGKIRPFRSCEFLTARNRLTPKVCAPITSTPALALRSCAHQTPLHGVGGAGGEGNHNLYQSGTVDRVGGLLFASAIFDRGGCKSLGPHTPRPALW